MKRLLGRDIDSEEKGGEKEKRREKIQLKTVRQRNPCSFAAPVAAADAASTALPVELDQRKYENMKVETTDELKTI